MTDALLEVEDLHVTLPSEDGILVAVFNLCCSIRACTCSLPPTDPSDRARPEPDQEVEMPCASRDELPLQRITPSYSTRMADWGGMTVGIEAAPAGMDASSSLKGLPGDRCQAHHWGYLLSGRIVIDYGERQETIVGDQAYYIEPGHLISFEEDSEAVEFTPTDELEQTLAAVREAAAEGT